MSTWTGQVASSTDDARCTSTGASFNATVTSQTIGLNAGVDFYNGFRWTGVTIPQGATITSATLDLFSSGTGTGSGTANGIFHGSLTPNIATFASGTNYPGQIGNTTASKTISVSNPAGTFNVTGFSISPFPIDVSAIIQELVNQVSWASGNALAIVGHDNGSTAANFIGNSTFDSNATRGATLTVTYTTGAPPATQGSVSSSLHPGIGVSNIARFIQSPPAIGGQIPNAPTGFTVVADNEYRTVAQWTDGGPSGQYDATNFLIERSTDNVNFTQINNVPGSQIYSIDLTCSPLTTYYYRVKARNSYGDSAYSPVITLTTPAVGQPWTAKVQGWVFPAAPFNPIVEYNDGRIIDTLKPETHIVASGGVITQEDVPTYGTYAYTPANGYSIKSYSNKQWITVSAGYTNFHALMNSSTNQSNGITTLVNFCVSTGYTGIELDLEGYGNWTSGDYSTYLTFLENLVSTAHASGITVAVVGPPIGDPTVYSDLKQSFYLFKYEDIAPLVDYVVALAYDYQFDYGNGTPMQPLAWAQTIAQWLINKVGWSNRSKIVMGLPMYGYFGTTGFNSLTEAPYKTMIQQTGALTATRDASSQELLYTNGGISGAYNDVVSINAKRQNVEDMGILNVSMWYIGGNLWPNGRVEPQVTNLHQGYVSSVIHPGVTISNLGRFKSQTLATPIPPSFTTTTQTVLGKSRIQLTTLQTITGVSRVTSTVPKTQTGKSRITVQTAQTQLGKSNIRVTTTQTQLGKARVTNMTVQTITGLARIALITVKTQLGKARVTATTLRTQLGVARITATALKTILGKTSIGTASVHTQLGKANIKNNTLQLQLGKARLTAVTAQTQLGKSRIVLTDLQTITGKARITQTTTQTITGKGDIKVTTLRTQTGISRLSIQTTKTQTGKSRLMVSSPRTQLGKANIDANTTQIQLGRARIQLTTLKTITGLARIAQTTLRTVTGLARITAIVARTQLGKASLVITTIQTITGKSRITLVSPKTQTGKSRITAITPHTQLGKSRISILTTQTQLGKAKVFNGQVRTQLGVARIRLITPQTITGKASIIAPYQRRNPVGGVQVVAPKITVASTNVFIDGRVS